MKTLQLAIAIAILFFGIAKQEAFSLEMNKSYNSADELFQAGKFEEAEKSYRKAVNADTKNFHAILQLGRIALFSNRLEDAQKWLKKAIELKPEEKKPNSLLAEVYYRQDAFQEASKLFQVIDKEAKAKKLASFKNVRPYDIQSKYEITHLKFVMTDPLPVVKVRVNNSGEVNFFIDTGGAELIIDSDFAREVGAHQFGAEMGVYAGGKKALYQHGRIDSLLMGDLEIKNLPVHIQKVRQFSDPIFGGKRVDGIIGTVVLYHFLATLDYPKGELILRLKTKDNLVRLEKEASAKESIIVPFWMAGDHYMVAWSTANKSEPMLFFVDTGLAGGGFTCPESTLKKAGIKLDESKAGEGIGGGGKVKIVPFVVDELTLGDAKEKSIRGFFSGPSPIENAFGFHIGGLISHGFFRHYALTFDFTDMRYFLKREKDNK